MLDFAKTGYGRKFFDHDIPALIRALKEIGEELKKARVRDDKVISEPVLGHFEEITDEEKAELATKVLKFDQFFNQLTENFNIDESTKINIHDLKALTRHVWNYKE